MHHEVVIIGAGPAGATAAARLAALGHDVLVLERETFPRFHIGESLLPMCLPVLAQLGVDLEGRFLRKAGAHFADESLAEEQTFWFSEALGDTPPYAYQVERATFDALLADAARAAGARIHYGERVSAVDTEGTSVAISTDKGQYTARYVIDASGQNAFFARSHRTQVPVAELGRAASFTHYENLSADAWSELAEHGNIIIFRQPQGWIWAIPLHERRLSLGVVSRQTPVPKELVHAAVDASPMLRRLTTGAQHSEARIIGDYSWGSERASGPRWVCVGDAGGFIDPVFSTGVTLALVSGSAAAERLHEALAAGGEAQPDLMQPVHAHMRIAYRSFSAIARRFYRTNWFRNIFLTPTLDPNLRRGLLTILAGDVWYRDNPFMSLLLGSGDDTSTPWYLGDSR